MSDTPNLESLWNKPPPENAPDVMYIDADTLVYAAAFEAQKADGEWNPDAPETPAEESLPVAHWEVAWSHFVASVETLKNGAGVRDVVLCYTGPKNFRYEHYSEYKSNRKDHVKPLLFDRVKDESRKHYTCTEYPNLEADDLVGILMTHPSISLKRCFSSVDKDLDQIPGLRWDPKTETMREITVEEANWKFWLQILTGDTTDGYKGIPGIGPKKAEKILQGCYGRPEAAMDAIRVAYESKGLTLDYLHSQARCARILRYEDILVEGEGWTPIPWSMP